MDAEKRLDELEGSIIHGASSIDPKNQEQIKERENQIKKVSAQKFNETDPKITSTTRVIGGITELSLLDDAPKWLNDILWDAYAPLPIETYVKGKNVAYAGVFCAKCSSAADRVKSLSVLETKLVEFGGKPKWADIDLPPTVRAPEKFLFALRKLLITWKFTDTSVRVDVDGLSKTLKVEGNIVVTATCARGHVVCEWTESWKNWAWLHDSAEFKLIVDECPKLLSGGKGNSKGKPH